MVGRAGRAIDNAYGILLSGAEDDEIADYFIRTAFPTAAEAAAVLSAVEKARAPMNRNALQRATGVTVIVVTTDRARGVPSYESWWDVPVAEVSEAATVRAAREDYEHAKLAERRFL